MGIDDEKSIKNELEWLCTLTEYKVCTEVTDWTIIHHRIVYVHVYCTAKKNIIKREKQKTLVYKHIE